METIGPTDRGGEAELAERIDAEWDVSRLPGLALRVLRYYGDSALNCLHPFCRICPVSFGSLDHAIN
jgi:hypothetical protein